MKVEVALRQRRVGVGIADVAPGYRFEPNPRNPPADAFHQGQHRMERGSRSAGNVEDHALDSRRLRGAEVGLDNVADEGEVTALGAIPVDGELALLEHGLAELMEGHVGTVSRSVHGEVAQGNRRDAVIAPVQATEVLGGELGHAVGGHRLGKRAFRHGEVPGISVNRRGGGVHQTLQTGRLYGCLEQSLRGADVRRGVDLEAGAPAGPHTCLGGLVKDPVPTVEQRPEVDVV